jgi:hypothetical protein
MIMVEGGCTCSLMGMSSRFRVDGDDVLDDESCVLGETGDGSCVFHVSN